jgi:hypothetical protein
MNDHAYSFLDLLQTTICRLVHMAFNIIPPTNITNLFGNLLAGVAKKDKVQT